MRLQSALPTLPGRLFYIQQHGVRYQLKIWDARPLNIFLCDIHCSYFATDGVTVYMHIQGAHKDGYLYSFIGKIFIACISSTARRVPSAGQRLPYHRLSAPCWECEKMK
jgi:hypothetical protein